MPRPINDTPFHVGRFLVKRVPSSSADYCAYHNHYWYGYLCPGKIPIEYIGRVGKLIEVTSKQQLLQELAVYRAEIGPSIKVDFAYYEVIDADA